MKAVISIRSAPMIQRLHVVSGAYAHFLAEDTAEINAAREAGPEGDFLSGRASLSLKLIIPVQISDLPIPTSAASSTE